MGPVDKAPDRISSMSSKRRSSMSDITEYPIWSPALASEAAARILVRDS